MDMCNYCNKYHQPHLVCDGLIEGIRNGTVKVIGNVVEEFVCLGSLANDIFTSDVEWKTKFELIFSDSISKKINKLGITIDWCDLDTSYEEDVTAYMKALNEKLDGLRKYPNKELKW